MAVASLGSTFNTTGGNTTVVATPTLSDLIVVIVVTTGVAGGTTNVSDNSSDGAGVYSKVAGDFTGFSTTGHLAAWVRNGLVRSASSTTYTATQASSTGGGLWVVRVTGMTLLGKQAVRSTGGQSSGTAGTTPAPVLSNTPVSTNPIIAAMCNGANPAAMTQRTGYTESVDTGYASPTTGVECTFLASGETTATLTWGSSSATSFASIGLELDLSTAPTVDGIAGATQPMNSVPDGLFPGLGVRW